MSMYAIKDTTLTALGDAVRSKTNGTTELPVPIGKENVEAGPYNLEVVEFPAFVKTVKVVGHVYDVDISNLNPQGILHNLAYASGVYTSELDLRRASDFTAINPNWAGVGYDFEITVKSNALTFTTELGYNSWEMTFVYDYTAIGLDENGNEFKYTPLEMVDKINGLMIVPDEAFTITGNCSQLFANNKWKWFINSGGSKITTKGLTAIDQMFSNSSYEYIPFDLNMAKSSNVPSAYSLFQESQLLKIAPMINNLKVGSSGSMFKGCLRLRSFPEGFADNWDFSGLKNTYSRMYACFENCYSLRKAPQPIISNCSNLATSGSYSSPYENFFKRCYCLDEINGFDVSQATLTSNMFVYVLDYCLRLKDFTFKTNEDGTPKTANWKNQTINLSMQVGYTTTSSKNLIIDYNSGITADKEVKDDATYQALKNDPDWFSADVNYSRYNHDSAVNTINSLPDCSASGGTNTIKFEGASGALTDGGAINTLTEEEIAVATAKGWTVSLV